MGGGKWLLMRIVYDVDKHIEDIKKARQHILNQKLKDDEIEIAILPIDSIIRYLNRIAVNVNIKEGKI